MASDQKTDQKTATKTSTHYGAASSSGSRSLQQSLLSAPPSSSRKVKSPTVVKKSVVNIVNPIHKFSKIIIWVYLGFGLASLVLVILSFVIDEWYFLLILILGTIVLSLFGAWGIYKWGTVQEQIDKFKNENSKYESQLVSLKNSSDRIGDEVRQTQTKVASLKKNVDDLQVTLKSYDELKKELKSIAGKNKTLNDMVNEVGNMFDGMQEAIIQNQRSSILQTYYDVQFKDDKKGLGKNEYIRFKGRLDAETRARFDKYGTFESFAGDDNNIDLAEFQDLLEQILLDMEEELLKKGTQ